MVDERYRDYPKHITFDGLNFYRDDKFGYYRHCFSKGNPIFLHRYVWEFYNGKIPEGYEIHHKDWNKSNNDISNLEMLTEVEHHKIHNENPTERQIEFRRKNRDRFLKKASEWHRSEEGRKWHSEHGKKCAAKCVKAKLTTIICKQCGDSVIRQSGAEFCSNACKAKWRRDNHIDDIDVPCSLCGKTFKRNKNQLNKDGLNYCSKVCASKVMYARTHSRELPRLTKFFAPK